MNSIYIYIYIVKRHSDWQCGGRTIHLNSTNVLNESETIIKRTASHSFPHTLDPVYLHSQRNATFDSSQHSRPKKH